MDMNKQIKKLDVLDIALTKWSAVFFGLLIATLWPTIITVAWYWFAAIMVLLAIRPTMRFFKQ